MNEIENAVNTVSHQPEASVENPTDRNINAAKAAADAAYLAAYNAVADANKHQGENK